MATKRLRGRTWHYTIKRAGLLAAPIYLSFADESEGDKYVAHLESLLAHGIVPEGFAREARPRKLRELLDAYRETVAVSDTDERVLSVIDARIGTTDLMLMRYDWCEQWIADMKRRERLSPSTIRHHVAALARCLDWGCRKDWLAGNPLRLLPRRLTQVAPWALTQVAPWALTQVAPWAPTNIAPRTATKDQPRALTNVAPTALSKVGPRALSQVAPRAPTNIASRALTKNAPRALTKNAPIALTDVAPIALTDVAPTALSKFGPRALQKFGPRALQKSGGRALQKLGPMSLQKFGPMVLQKFGPRALWWVGQGNHPASPPRACRA